MKFLTEDKLTIVGAAGMIGSNMAQTAMMMHLTPNICLYDPFAPALEGVAEELFHCGFEDVNLTFTSDVATAFKDAKYKMLLSLYSPNESELNNIDYEYSYYSLIKRNGFIYSQTYSDTLLKRKSLCMFKEGSCFIGNINGDIKDVSHNGNHKVYRYGKALYIGIDI